jgi:hypothetical protein
VHTFTCIGECLCHFQWARARSPLSFLPSQEFYQWFLWQSGEDLFFSSCILLAAGAGFTRNGILNFHSMHIWSDVNPHSTVQLRYQNQFSVNTKSQICFILMLCFITVWLQSYIKQFIYLFSSHFRVYDNSEHRILIVYSFSGPAVLTSHHSITTWQLHVCLMFIYYKERLDHRRVSFVIPHTSRIC